MIKKILLFIIAIISAITINAQTVLVQTQKQLNDAIENASAGTTIILDNRTWIDAQIDIDKDGTEANPIIIKAKTPGEVFFEGDCSIVIDGKYITLEGIIIQNPSRIDPYGTYLIEIAGDYCTLTNIKINSYNGSESQKYGVYKWIYIRGIYNEVSYSSFVGKYGIGSIINHNRNNSTADYTKIHHNYFGGRRAVSEINEENDQDAIRLGNSSTSLFSSYSEVYNNYFDDFQGEIEVISNKSCNNKYYNNTFRNYSGSLTLRHGNNCEVYNNFFFANDHVLSCGIRVMGENHKIYNNYIEGTNYNKPSGSGSSATGGINVSNGVPNSDLNEYYQVKNTTITNNTFVNCDYALRVGTQVKSSCTLAPENLVIANNIFFNSSESAIEEITTPIGDSSIYQGNINQIGDWDIADGENYNQTVTTNLVEKGDYMYNLAYRSPAIDAGIDTYSFLIKDVLDGSRPANFDAGAEEYGAKGLATPYTGEDIGIRVGFGSIDTTFLKSTATELVFAYNAQDLDFIVNSNVEWTISDDASWLSLSETGLTGDASISATTTKNNSGSERTATITLSEVGGNNMETTISVKQYDSIFVPENATEITPIIVDGVGTQPNSTNTPDKTINNILSDYWAGESNDGSAYTTYDFGCKHVLTDISIYFLDGDSRTYSFKIFTSTDGISFTEKLDLSSALQDGFQDFDMDLDTAQYVRIKGYGNSSSDWNRYTEVKFYGDENCYLGSSDPAPPVITSTHLYQQIGANENCEGIIPDYTSSVTLEVPGAVISQEPSEGTSIFDFTKIVLTATDAIGQKDVVNFNATVTDETVPVISSVPENQEFKGDANSRAPLPDYTSQVVATDNCDSQLSITQQPTAGTDTSSCTVTILVIDADGNVSTENFAVTITEGPLPPVITSTHPNQQINADANCEAILPDYRGDLTLAVEYEFTDTTQIPSPGSTITGNTKVQLVVKDDIGQTDIVSFYVLAYENIEPKITSIPDNKTITGNLDGETILEDYTNQVVASDNCDNNLSITQDPSPGTQTSSCNVVITVSDLSGNFTTDNFDLTVIPRISSTQEVSNIVSIYPNPSNGIINIKGLNINSIAVIDITGKVIMTDFVNDNTATIDLRDQAQGLYFMKISTEDGIYTKKIMLE